MRGILIVLLLVAASSTARAGNHCVILQYHHFSDSTPRITSVTPQQFADHLDYLQQNNFQVMALQDVVLALHHQLDLPDKCVSLSVDDAYLSVYATAFPMLKKRGWPLTVFVNSQSIDQQKKPFMSWQQMREMAQHGVRFENHGHEHMHMIRKRDSESEAQWLQRVSSDIETAQQRISAELGRAPTLFAWPYGEFNATLAKQIRQLGFIAFGQQSGPAWPDANPAYLPRFPMAAQYADLPGFITKVSTLPLPVVKAAPRESIVALGQLRPRLTLTLAPGKYSKHNLRCFISGSDKVEMVWDESVADTVHVSPLFDLKPGRHRSNCTMPSNQKGRFHWYSHNWFVRHPDGSWYAEY